MTPTRRWLLRSSFLLALLICLLGWVWSIQHIVGVRYQRGTIVAASRSYWGVLMVNVASDHTLGGFAKNPGFYVEAFPLSASPQYWPNAGPNSWGGFACMWYSSPIADDCDFEVSVPYWFVLILLGAVTWWVWRKTRPKISPATAFPIEITETKP